MRLFELRAGALSLSSSSISEILGRVAGHGLLGRIIAPR